MREDQWRKVSVRFMAGLIMGGLLGYGLGLDLGNQLGLAAGVGAVAALAAYWRKR